MFDLSMSRVEDELGSKALRYALKAAGAVLTDYQIDLLTSALGRMTPEENSRIWKALIPVEAQRPAPLLDAALGQATLLDGPGIAILLLGIKAYRDHGGELTQVELNALLTSFGLKPIGDAAFQSASGGKTKLTMDTLRELLPTIVAGTAFVGTLIATHSARLAGEAALIGGTGAELLQNRLAPPKP